LARSAVSNRTHPVCNPPKTCFYKSMTGTRKSHLYGLLHSMRHLITLSVLLAVFAPAIVHAKRKAPPKVQRVVHEGVRYTAPNDDGRRAYVQAWDAASNKMLWEVTIFRNVVTPLLEEDVQHVYIKSMSIQDGNLVLLAEDGRAYSVGLKTRTVKTVKQAPREKTRANESLQRTAELRFIQFDARPAAGEFRCYP
jgi:hypothetical protein